MDLDLTQLAASERHASACLMTSAAGLVVQWSSAAEVLFGIVEHDALGHYLEDLIAPRGNHANGFVGADFTAARTSHAVLCRRGDGALIHASIATHPGSCANQPAVWFDVEDVTTARVAQDSRLVETKFRSLLESMPDGIVIVNATGHIAFANSQAAAMFGYDAGELKGMALDLLVPQRLRATHGVHRARFFEQPRPRAMGAGLELFGTRKNGSEFHLEISLSSLEIEESRLVMSAVRDISARYKADQMFKQLLESAPYAKVIVDHNGKIIIVNSQIQKLFGYTRDEIVGQNVELLMPERYRAKHPSHRNRFFADPQLRPMGAGFELFARRKDGNEFPVEISLSPLEPEHGVLVSASIRDISERKRFEQALHEKNLQLESASRAKDRFLASMSHELRTPLNAIIGFTGTLLMRLPGPLTPDQDTQLTTVQASARHLLALINDLLDVAKIEAEKIDVKCEPTDCQLLLAEIAATLQPAAKKKDLQVLIEPSIGASTISTDRRLVNQIVINLVDNAIKFTERGGVTLSVVRDTDRSLIIKVRDSGRGIGIEDQRKLFQPFSRVESLGAAPTAGTGLGLHLSKKLAEHLGGTLECESAPGVGSTFSLRVVAR